MGRHELAVSRSSLAQCDHGRRVPRRRLRIPDWRALRDLARRGVEVEAKIRASMRVNAPRGTRVGCLWFSFGPHEVDPFMALQHELFRKPADAAQAAAADKTSLA